MIDVTQLPSSQASELFIWEEQAELMKELLVNCTFSTWLINRSVVQFLVLPNLISEVSLSKTLNPNL